MPPRCVDEEDVSRRWPLVGLLAGAPGSSSRPLKVDPSGSVHLTRVMPACSSACLHATHGTEHPIAPDASQRSTITSPPDFRRIQAATAWGATPCLSASRAASASSRRSAHMRESDTAIAFFAAPEAGPHLTRDVRLLHPALIAKKT